VALSQADIQDGMPVPQGITYVAPMQPSHRSDRTLLRVLHVHSSWTALRLAPIPRLRSSIRISCRDVIARRLCQRTRLGLGLLGVELFA